MILTFESDLDYLAENLEKMQQQVLPKSTTQALNKTNDKVYAESSRIIRAQANVKSARIKKDTQVLKANINSQTAGISMVKARATNLIEYVTGDLTRFRRRTKSGEFTQRAKQGVVARPYEKSKPHKGAFIGRAKGSGKVMVFKRKGLGRNAKIQAVHAASPRRIFSKKETKQKLESKARIEFPIELGRAIANNIS